MASLARRKSPRLPEFLCTVGGSVGLAPSQGRLESIWASGLGLRGIHAGAAGHQEPGEGAGPISAMFRQVRGLLSGVA